MVCAGHAGRAGQLNAGKVVGLLLQDLAARAAAGQTWPKAGLPCLRMQP